MTGKLRVTKQSYAKHSKMQEAKFKQEITWPNSHMRFMSQKCNKINALSQILILVTKNHPQCQTPAMQTTPCFTACWRSVPWQVLVQSLWASVARKTKWLRWKQAGLTCLSLSLLRPVCFGCASPISCTNPKLPKKQILAIILSKHKKC